MIAAGPMTNRRKKLLMPLMNAIPIMSKKANTPNGKTKIGLYAFLTKALIM